MSALKMTHKEKERDWRRIAKQTKHLGGKGKGNFKTETVERSLQVS